MPKTTSPRDRFDEIPDEVGRVGAHRAENPRMRGGVVFLWAALATVVLIAVGIFGTLLASGRIELFPTPTPTPTVAPEVAPVVDTSYGVLILNATPEAGQAIQFRDVVVGAGWPAETVLAGDAGSQDFATTTVYYPKPEDEAAARGLAGVIGGAAVELSAVYQPADNPDAKQLALVIGLDRTSNPPAPSPSS